MANIYIPLNKKLVKEIDELIFSCIESGKYVHAGQTTDLRDKALEFCLVKNFLKKEKQSLYSLDKKGFELLDKDGYENYTKSIKQKKLDWYKIIPIILTVLLSYSTFYYANRNYNLKLKESRYLEFKALNDSLLKRVDSLKSELLNYKSKSLNQTK